MKLKTRDGTEHWQGVLLSSWQPLPVFHAFDYCRRTGSLEEGRVRYEDVTSCGRGYRNPSAVLLIEHLLKFARPCKVCWHPSEHAKGAA